VSDWVAFCDGACSGNPGPGGWAALIWEPEMDLVRELGGGEDPTTNNRMELRAVIAALETFIEKSDSERDTLWVLSDSSYVVRGIEEWVPRWKSRNWQKAGGEEVSNLDLWQQLEKLASQVKRIRWNHVMGHSGVAENERVDAIAVAFSKKEKNIRLFSGARMDHPIEGLFSRGPRSVSEWVREVQLRSQSSATPKKSKAPTSPGSYYVSIVKGGLERHTTWTECESRVKGVSGARFKKVKNAEEEKSFVASLPAEVFKK
jgi:ribonuclease HI